MCARDISSCAKKNMIIIRMKRARRGRRWCEILMFFNHRGGGGDRQPVCANEWKMNARRPNQRKPCGDRHSLPLPLPPGRRTRFIAISNRLRRALAPSNATTRLIVKITNIIRERFQGPAESCACAYGRFAVLLPSLFFFFSVFTRGPSANRAMYFWLGMVDVFKKLGQNEFKFNRT